LGILQFSGPTFRNCVNAPLRFWVLVGGGLVGGGLGVGSSFSHVAVGVGGGFLP